MIRSMYAYIKHFFKFYLAYPLEKFPQEAFAGLKSKDILEALNTSCKTAYQNTILIIIQ